MRTNPPSNRLSRGDCFPFFTQDLNYHPAGPFDAPSNIFITPVSKGRFLLAGTEDGPAGDRDGPNPITVISRVMADGSLDQTVAEKKIACL